MTLGKVEQCAKIGIRGDCQRHHFDLAPKLMASFAKRGGDVKLSLREKQRDLGVGERRKQSVAKHPPHKHATSTIAHDDHVCLP